MHLDQRDTTKLVMWLDLASNDRSDGGDALSGGAVRLDTVTTNLGFSGKKSAGIR